MAAAVPEWRLARVMEGYVTTQLLYVAAKLGIPEVLAAGFAPARRSRRPSGPTPLR